MHSSDECPLYADAQLYDALFPDLPEAALIADQVRRQRIQTAVTFYLDEAAKSQGPLLDLGCGAGRLSIPIAQSGVPVHGVDLSASMLAAARAKAARLDLRIGFTHADMRTFELHQCFATILIAGNALLHLLATEDILQCLENVRRHLAPGGRLIFDVAKWDLALLAREPGQRFPVMQVAHPKLGEISIEERAAYDSAAQVREISWLLSTPTQPDFRVIDYRLRAIFPQELLLLLDRAGLRLETRYGEFTRAPFDSRSPRQVCICSPR